MIASCGRIGRFRLEDELGRGSYSVVWRAHDPILERDVAIKIPRHELDPLAVERYLREAKRVAQLNHEGIVRVFEANIDEQSAIPFIVLELVEGVTLNEWCSFLDLSYWDKAEIVAKVARAVDHAHRAGIIHRDLKPANVLVGLSGRVQVADFGLAVAAGLDVTFGDATVGTIAYMSPEQARLVNNPISEASDVFSIGTILFELLAGTNPIDANTPSEHLAKLAIDDRKVLKKVKPNLPLDLVTICEKAIKLNPHDRYSMAGELAEELERFAVGLPIKSRQLSTTERFSRFVNLNNRILGLTLICAVIVGLCCVLVLVDRRRLNQEREARKHVAVLNMLNCQPEGVPSACAEISKLFDNRVAEFESICRAEAPHRTVRRQMALAAMGHINCDLLMQSIPNCPEEEVSNLVDALSCAREASLEALRKSYQSEHANVHSDVGLHNSARFAILLAHLGDLEGVIELTQLDDDPTDRTILLEVWPSFHGRLDDLINWSQKSIPAPLLSAIIEVLAVQDNIVPVQSDAIGRTILANYANDASASVHSMALWASKKRGQAVQLASTSRAASTEWRELDHGFAMVRRKAPGGSSTTISISAREITNEQFWQFAPEHAEKLKQKYNCEHSKDDAVRYIDTTMMFEFCNFLSDRYSLARCYRLANEMGLDGNASYEVNFDANGFRLPTVSEWEIANLAGSKFGYFFGDDDQFLPRYANISGQPRSTETMRFPPNAFGLFDTLGNVYEACHPDVQSRVCQEVYYCGGSLLAIPGDHRRGKMSKKRLNYSSALFGFRVVSKSSFLEEYER